MTIAESRPELGAAGAADSAGPGRSQRVAERQQERTLSIGDAVQFTHRGKTIHGHLLRRQGRRRLATVIDGEEALWKVPEAALTPSGRPRRTTMLTREDAARARWRVGDRVAFVGPDGERQTGKIVKLNPTQARVRAGRTLWNVPYGGLSDTGTGKNGARDGAERLASIATMARGLMDEHGLAEWTFAFLEAKRRLGDCNFHERVIRIGRAHALDASEAEIRDTILHEIAHALAGPEARHGPQWKAIAKRIGATPRANVYERRRR